MSLPDKFFLWPYTGPGLQQAIDDISPLLAASGLADCLDDERRGKLAEFIALECRHWNVSPWWILVSGQREQSVLNGEKLDDKAAEAWLGVVNADVGRTVNPGYYGVYTQVARCCEVSAWLLGVEDSRKWPLYERTAKEAKRYHIGITLPVEVDGAEKEVMPLSAGDYLQLAYTPHMKTLGINESIARKYVPLRFL